jgi:hypothetical protein
MDLTEFESPVGILEFHFEPKAILRHHVATNGAAGTGSGPTPNAYLMLPWKHAGANRRAGLPT